MKGRGEDIHLPHPIMSYWNYFRLVRNFATILSVGPLNQDTHKVRKNHNSEISLRRVLFTGRARDPVPCAGGVHSRTVACC